MLYRLNVKRRKKWLSQFVAEAGVAAAWNPFAHAHELQEDVQIWAGEKVLRRHNQMQGVFRQSLFLTYEARWR